MIVELRGVEFSNKGAELMLHAIIEKVKENNPNAIFVMEPNVRVSKEKLKEFGIHVKMTRKAKFIPRFIRRKLKVAHGNEINVVLDGSGFAFGDQWGANYAKKRLGSTIATWRKQGKKVILLPQAFGPFNNKDLKEVVENIIDNADLIFAREKQSFDYLKKISNNDKIRQAPDFTNLINGKIPQGFDSANNQVAIIPNRKMIQKSEDEGKLYINFLCEAIKKIIEIGLKPYFLIHEGEQDIEIAKKINHLLKQPLEIIINQDPLAIKGIISTACFIICSRFHGVVSALSQGVPCITTSWSHKYEMLHKEYDFLEGVMKNIGDHNEIDQKIKMLAYSEKNKSISENLLRNSKKQKERSAEMWQIVFKVLNGQTEFI